MSEPAVSVGASRAEGLLGESRPVRFLPGASGEHALVARLLAGEELAFREAYEAHAPRLLRLLSRMVRDRAMAEEVLQESFAAAFRSLSTYRAETTLGAWLTRIAVRHGLNALRFESRRALREETSRVELVHEPRLDEQQDAVLLLKLVEELDTPKRVTMLLHAEGHTATEIAELLGERRGTILARIFRTRRELQEKAVAAGLVELDELHEGAGR